MVGCVYNGRPIEREQVVAHSYIVFVGRLFLWILHFQGNVLLLVRRLELEQCFTEIYIYGQVAGGVVEEQRPICVVSAATELGHHMTFDVYPSIDNTITDIFADQNSLHID